MPTATAKHETNYCVRLTADERRKLEILALASGTRRSDAIRLALSEAAERRARACDQTTAK